MCHNVQFLCDLHEFLCLLVFLISFSSHCREIIWIFFFPSCNTLNIVGRRKKAILKQFLSLCEHTRYYKSLWKYPWGLENFDIDKDIESYNKHFKLAFLTVFERDDTHMMLRMLRMSILETLLWPQKNMFTEFHKQLHCVFKCSYLTGKTTSRRQQFVVVCSVGWMLIYCQKWEPARRQISASSQSQNTDSVTF